MSIHPATPDAADAPKGANGADGAAPYAHALRHTAVWLCAAACSALAFSTHAQTPAQNQAQRRPETPPAAPTNVLEQVKARGTVRVCIWPQYYGITYRNPRTGKLEGIDIELSSALGQEQGWQVQYVESSFATLVDDLTENRCDVSMHAVGITPQRQAVLDFSNPYLRSGIYGVSTRSNRLVRQWSDIDQPGVRVAVQAGTFMEPVMREALQQAQMVVIRPPQTREEELEAGRVDVFMTDYPYSRRLLDNADWARLITPPQPYHPIDYAYAVRQGQTQWLAVINQFIEKIKSDGRLRTAAQRAGLGEIVLVR